MSNFVIEALHRVIANKEAMRDGKQQQEEGQSYVHENRERRSRRGYPNNSEGYRRDEYL